eukprot:3944441-Pleurochrysis_carterae.AAC.1
MTGRGMQREAATVMLVEAEQVWTKRQVTAMRRAVVRELTAAMTVEQEMAMELEQEEATSVEAGMAMMAAAVKMAEL